MKRDVLDLQKYLPPVALLKMQQRLRSMKQGDRLEIRVGSLELLKDVERLLLTSSIRFSSEKLRGQRWLIYIER